MILSLAAFTTLAAQCGPSVHHETLAAIARTESGFNTLAISDNHSRRSHRPASVEAAVATATALIRQGHSIDLGVMQINSKNLRGLGMTVADTFDACKSIAAGARILRDGYRQPGAGEDNQPALMRALSRYNTGHPTRGFANGYVRRVFASAGQVVPAIRLGGAPVVVAGPEGGSVSVNAPPAAPALPPAPPTWDVYGTARFKRDYGDVVENARAPVPVEAVPFTPAFGPDAVNLGAGGGAPVQLQRAPGGGNGL